MNKVFNYIRVSSKEQNEGRQQQAMQEFNEVNNIVNAIELIDKASGTNTDRPNLQMLLKVVGEEDLVVIKSIDRLSRNYKEVMELWNTITDKGADIVVIDMPMLDTRQHKDLLGDFISNLILQVLSYVAQQETDFRKQRQLEGIAIAKEQGKHLGRPKADYPNNFETEYKAWKEGQQTAKATMDNLQLKRTTFYKLVKQYELTNDFANNTNKEVKDIKDYNLQEIKLLVANRKRVFEELGADKNSILYKQYIEALERLKELEG
ncbi:MAG: recombinase family protein [Romboutsia sp.]|uniref:recombinase family protein n=1 Tax=Romboutsia sp. TaxID=1965302 RepID=UPI003F37E460